MLTPCAPENCRGHFPFFSFFLSFFLSFTVLAIRRLIDEVMFQCLVFLPAINLTSIPRKLGRLFHGVYITMLEQELADIDALIIGDMQTNTDYLRQVAVNRLVVDRSSLIWFW